LWQFIPATGKRFNLEQNWWRDERRDVVASTNAALDYLQTIYEMHGDWHLALASYNWGEGAVKRAIEKNEARGLPTDYPNLKMPNETRHYVPKLQALKNILGNPLLMHRLGLPDLANEPYFTTYETRRPMDVITAARLANMSVEEFQRLNPAHNRPIINPETPLVLPADKMETFNANLRQHTAPLTQWQAYTVRSPERADQIASRFGISTAELIRANSLPGNVRLAAGSKLLVPGDGDIDSLKGVLATEASPAIVQAEPRPSKKSRASDKAASSKKTSSAKTKASSPKAKPKSSAPAKAPAKGKKRS
jgi:membrane-bound lytic murein transglycosylase D